MNTVPATIDTACAPLNDAWERYANSLVSGPDSIIVADTDAALNWDAFLGRSVPLQPGVAFGSRGARGPNLAAIQQHGIRLRDLAELWQIEPLRLHFMQKGEAPAGEPARASCSTLLASGGPAGKLLCAAFEALPESSTHWSVRALLQNAALLGETDYSFRAWLERESRVLGESSFPPLDFRRMVMVTEPNGVAQRSLEHALANIMGRVFHRAGGVVAAHILADWQLGLWLAGRTAVFDLYPHDQHHRRFVADCPDLPADEAGFAKWWHAQPGCAGLPPRLASACMARAVHEQSA